MAADSGAGYGKFQNYVQAPSFDTTGATVLTVAPTNATGVTIGATSETSPILLNAGSGQYTAFSVGGTTAAFVSSSAIDSWNFGATALGGASNAFGAAYLGASTTAGSGYVTWGATGGTLNSQHGILSDTRFDFETNNASFGPYNAQTYTIVAHHGLTFDREVTCRVVTPGVGGTFWTAAADNTYSCRMVGSVGYTGAAALQDSIWYGHCDCAGGTCTSASAPTNVLIQDDGSFNTGTGVAQVGYILYNDGSTTKPVLDCVSHLVVTDD